METVWHLDLCGSPPRLKQWFLRTAPPRSFALDGWLTSRPFVNVEKRVANIDHHKGVDRIITRCTAAQFALSLRLGRYSRFFDGEGPVHSFFESIDPDVIFTLWIMENWHRVMTRLEWRFENLLRFLDLVDSTAATYPFPIDQELCEFQWVFDPYFNALARQELDHKNIDVYHGVVFECFERIERYLVGAGGRASIDQSYDVLEDHQRWGIFRAHGSLSRMKIVADGYFAFVLVRKRADGNLAMTLQRTCPEIDWFPINRMYKPLNLVENRHAQWGGNGIVGGSPVPDGTWQSVARASETVQAIIATSGKNNPLRLK